MPLHADLAWANAVVREKTQQGGEINLNEQYLGLTLMSSMSSIEAFYFSAITITTVGYGDIAPNQSIPQLLVVYEVILGLALVVVAFGAYMDKSSDA